MRKVVLGLGISLDGYIARLDGTLTFFRGPYWPGNGTASSSRANLPPR